MDFIFNNDACKTCGGRCCIGESGYIFLSLKEAESIAKFLDLEFENFALKFLKKVGYRFSLIEKPYENGAACIFFDEQCKNCAIYSVRPSQCKSFPFWENLDKEALKICPGVKFSEN